MGKKKSARTKTDHRRALARSSKTRVEATMGDTMTEPKREVEFGRKVYDSERHRGRIKRVTRRGFGFIGWDGERDLWFHFSEAKFKPEPGQAVEFGLKETYKGPAAIDLERINEFKGI